ncbi:hypothetical protein [Pedosphaera parvula]|uniref:Uncharacterized protein n=1 Tax=Pedosphaera parvula (strain Ellin514) TaxID=320771 RepID=B9XIC5_PEDPL|nr:hypothetical protein [Pedosphaera parvula]EEF60386.1 conserved hypothetical protein [Pedosphaera parvula Ellin514]
MILQKGEKVHMIHRRLLDKDPHRHFVGIVDAYENGVARVTGHMYTVDPTKFSFFKRPEKRTRIVSLISGDVFVNILPEAVDLEDITYKQEKKSVRVTDCKDWHMDISEFAWR